MGDSDGGKKRNGISRSLKRFFGVGDFGFSFMTNIETYYFTYFLTNIAEFSLPIVTMITTIASVVDAALSWIYGVILDTFKPMKWGRYRSWLVVIPWLVPFLYAFQFVRVGSGTAAVVIIIAATITSHIAWNIPIRSQHFHDQHGFQDPGGPYGSVLIKSNLAVSGPGYFIPM